jgi:hypothetical protein
MPLAQPNTGAAQLPPAADHARNTHLEEAAARSLPARAAASPRIPPHVHAPVRRRSLWEPRVSHHELFVFRHTTEAFRPETGAGETASSAFRPELETAAPFSVADAHAIAIREPSAGRTFLSEAAAFCPSPVWRVHTPRQARSRSRPAP